MPNVYKKYSMNEYYFSSSDKFLVYADIEGEIQFIKYQIINFYILAYFNDNGNKVLNMLICSQRDDYQYNSEFYFKCNTFMYDVEGKDIEFLPYIFYNDINSPYEIMMNNSIKAENPYDTNYSVTLKISILLLYIFLLL